MRQWVVLCLANARKDYERLRGRAEGEAVTQHQAALFSGNSGAQFSPDRVYRYALWRIWDDDLGIAAFIGLNPSVADEVRNDPTIRREIDFAKRWGFGGIYKVNLFGYRSTDPKKLRLVDDPIGPDNDRMIAEYARGASIVIAAWGSRGSLYERGKGVREMLYEGAGDDLYHLELTKCFHPRHPLYLSKTTEPTQW